MAINFEATFNTLKQGVATLAQTTVSNYVAQATADGQAFLDQTKTSLAEWTGALAAGKMTKEDFAELVMGQKDLLEMTALTQAGLAAIQLDNFKMGVLQLVETTILSLV